MRNSATTSAAQPHSSHAANLWLSPKRGWKDKYVNIYLFAVVTFAVLTVITIILMDQLPAGWIKALGVFLNFIITFVFGLSVEFWRQNARSGDENREQALRVSKRLDNDMQQLSAELVQAANPLMFFESKNDIGFKHASGHLLIHALDTLKNRIERAGLEISELGFDQSLFIAEKGAKLQEIKEQALNTLEAILPGFPHIQHSIYLPALPASAPDGNGTIAQSQP